VGYQCSWPQFQAALWGQVYMVFSTVAMQFRNPCLDLLSLNPACCLRCMFAGPLAAAGRGILVSLPLWTSLNMPCQHRLKHCLQHCVKEGYDGGTLVHV
jgi:hypothetical protein